MIKSLWLTSSTLTPLMNQCSLLNSMAWSSRILCRVPPAPPSCMCKQAAVTEDPYVDLKATF